MKSAPIIIYILTGLLFPVYPSVLNTRKFPHLITSPTGETSTPVWHRCTNAVIGFQLDVVDQCGIGWNVCKAVHTVAQLARDVHLPTVSDVHILERRGEALHVVADGHLVWHAIERTEYVGFILANTRIADELAEFFDSASSPSSLGMVRVMKLTRTVSV